jgi:hypothetical protein
MKVKTSIKAGGMHRNHNETLIRGTKALKVKTNVKAGGLSGRNHNETLARKTRG